MNRAIFTGAVCFIFFTCFASQVKCNCFDMEKYAKNEKAHEGMTEHFKTMVKNLCEKASDVKDCMKEKATDMMTAGAMQAQVKEYIADEAKGKEINALIDNCFKENKKEFFSCYFNGLVKICPEVKDKMEEFKKPMADFM